MALNARQSRFADEFMIDRNAARAYVRAGYSPNGAKQSAKKLLTHTDLQQRLSEAEAQRSATLQWTAADILRDIREIAENPNNLPRDRLRAYELAGKHLGMFRDVLEHRGSVPIDFSGISTDDLKSIIGVAH